MPAKVVHYLTLDEAIAIHQGLIERFGGLEGVRDLGLLENALYRSRTGYYQDLAEMAAALFESLLMNHAFIDGNKRSFFCNGYLPPSERLEAQGGTQRRS